MATQTVLPIETFADVVAYTFASAVESNALYVASSKWTYPDVGITLLTVDVVGHKLAKDFSPFGLFNQRVVSSMSIVITSSVALS